MDYKISEDKFLKVINNWINLEFPTVIEKFKIDKSKCFIIYRDDTNDNGVTFKYHYDDNPLQPNSVRKHHLIVAFDIEESFSKMFGEENLPYLGKWFELVTNNPVKSIS